MNAIDYVVLVGTMLGIALYGTWRTRGRRDLTTYLKGAGNTNWMVIGLSVMATQASAITFMSTPGQGFESGLGFVQIYFGMPLALIIIAACFLPMYRRLNVHTAYEFLGQRFDAKTRLLAGAIFLLQRGLAAGITIYAPAIVLSAVLGWRLDLTIICCGLLATVYTVTGGSDAVTITQKYQIAVIFAGMLAALIVAIIKLPSGITLPDTLALAGTFGKLNAVSFSFDPRERYTLWSGLLGGTCLMLSYFGTDQSQVQRYIGGGSLRESRLGLMFNAICKIPMQFLILGLGVLVFVFYQFEKPPVFFNEVAWQSAAEHGRSNELKAIEANFAVAHAEQRNHLEAWIKARQSGDAEAELAAQEAVLSSRKAIQAIRIQAKGAADLKNRPPEDQPKDTDYVFINFVLDHLPHGAIGLLIATFFAAALSSKAAELNALGSTTTVDFYQQVFKRKVSDSHYVLASKCFIAFWGMVAICFALFANLTENLIQAVNIVGSIFYGVVLGLFLVAFFLRWIGGTSAFWGALMAQLLVFLLFFSGQISDLLTSIDFQLEWLSNLVYRVCGALNDVRKLSFLWYNLIGCVACVLFSLILQLALSSRPERGMPPSTS